MAKGILDIREEVRLAKLDVGLLQRMDCTEEENKIYLKMIQQGQTLPEGVYRYETTDGTELDEFYVMYDPQLTEKEQQEYLSLMQYKEIKTIRKCAVALTVFAAIALALGLWIIYCSIA